MTDPVSSNAVTTERVDGVLVVHLDDGKANALSTASIATVRAAIADAAADADLHAVVVHGRPGRFSGGFDLNVMRGGDLAEIVGLVSDGGELVRDLYGASVPVVAACTGHAIAAGALMLLGCDLRVGADLDCKIGLNEVAIGMVLPDWAITIATERLSLRHVQHSIALAKLYDARGALDAGFLDVVVPEGDVLARAISEATALGALDARAYAGTVRALRGVTLERMTAQIASDRDAVRSPV